MYIKQKNIYAFSYTYMYTNMQILIFINKCIIACVWKATCVYSTHIWGGYDCRLLKIIGLFCRISSLLQGSFTKETYKILFGAKIYVSSHSLVSLLSNTFRIMHVRSLHSFTSRLHLFIHIYTFFPLYGVATIVGSLNS